MIKFDKFMVRHYDHLQVLANTNLELPGAFLFHCNFNSIIVLHRLSSFLIADVVGEIQYVQGSDLKNNAATSRVVVRFLIERYVMLDFLPNFV